jgi:hypothetical protein
MLESWELVRDIHAYLNGNSNIDGSGESNISGLYSLCISCKQSVIA